MVKHKVSRNHIMAGSIIGALLGASAGLIFETGFLGALVGIIAGGFIGLLFGHGETREHRSPPLETVVEKHGREARMQLREEQLHLTKTRVQTGSVAMHREVSTDEETIVVPVSREDLVIEETVFEGGEPTSETIRIPISEERVEVIKHPVLLNDVSVYKRHFQETECVDETLKKEVLRLDTSGNPPIVETEKTS